MGFSRLAVLLGLFILGTSFIATPSCADSWALPTTETYNACNRHARVIVTPRDLESQLAYFEDKVDHVQPAGQALKGARVATARLQTLIDGNWRTIWEKPIVNQVAPVHAIVRDDAAYVVTFDDWHGMGYGPNVVVIYGPSGERVRALALSDLMPQDFVDALPHSVSSIHWRGNPYFSSDGRRVVIPVVIPESGALDGPAHVETTIDLATGAVKPAIGLAWQQAVGTARQVRAEQRAEEAKRKAAFIAPLLGPTINDERPWHEYLREGVARITNEKAFPATKVLRDPAATDYAITETWLHDALTESYADHVAVASIAPSNMVPVLRKIAASVPRGSLGHVTLYVAARNDIWPGIRDAMRSTGVKLVQLNPDLPIPQRRGRIVERYGR